MYLQKNWMVIFLFLIIVFIFKRSYLFSRSVTGLRIDYSGCCYLHSCHWMFPDHTHWRIKSKLWFSGWGPCNTEYNFHRPKHQEKKIPHYINTESSICDGWRIMGETQKHLLYRGSNALISSENAFNSSFIYIWCSSLINISNLAFVTNPCRRNVMTLIWIHNPFTEA